MHKVNDDIYMKNDEFLWFGGSSLCYDDIRVIKNLYCGNNKISTIHSVNHEKRQIDSKN